MKGKYMEVLDAAVTSFPTGLEMVQVSETMSTAMAEVALDTIMDKEKKPSKPWISEDTMGLTREISELACR
eukprot:15477862-Alexandrium_andersonii.AAC.1